MVWICIERLRRLHVWTLRLNTLLLMLVIAATAPQILVIDCGNTLHIGYKLIPRLDLLIIWYRVKPNITVSLWIDETILDRYLFIGAHQ